MKILTGIESAQIRERFQKTFLDFENPYYHSFFNAKLTLENYHQYTDYMWDILKNKEVIWGAEAEKRLQEQGEIFLMWDDNRFIPLQFPYARKGVLRLTFAEFQSQESIFPDDVYFFDESYSWAIALTHTYQEEGRWCLWIRLK